MGRGDKKSRRGKIAIGSYGVSRNRKKIKAHLKRAMSKPAVAVAETAVPEKPKIKRAAKKKEAASE